MKLKAMEVTVESQGVLQKSPMLDKGMLDIWLRERSKENKMPKKLQIVNNQQ